MSKTKSDKQNELDCLQFELEDVQGQLTELRMRERYLKTEVEKLEAELGDEE